MLRQLSASLLGGHRARQGFIFVLAAGFLAWAPRLHPPVDDLTALEKFGFDVVQYFGPTRPSSEVQVIEMDQESFRQLEQNTVDSWDRALHARLLRKLTKDGARVVIFDILLDK